MTAEYVRRHYGVPAKRRGLVRFDGRPGLIVGFRNQYLRVRLEGDAFVSTLHPTWRVEYLPAAPTEEPTDV